MERVRGIDKFLHVCYNVHRAPKSPHIHRLNA